MSKDSNAKIFSIVGGCRRSGRWLVPAKTKMMTLFGRAIIDLRQAQTSAEEIEFTCMSVFANITFLVPEGAEVRPSGMAIFGSSRSMVPLSEAPCGLPPMSIDATTVFGRLRVRTTDIDPEEKPRKRRSRRRNAAEPLTAPLATPTATSVDTPVRPAEPIPEPSPAPAPRRTVADLSAPIEPFLTDDDDDADVSPIHNVEVPDAPEFLTDDPEPAAAEAPDTPEFLTDDPEPAAADA